MVLCGTTRCRFIMPLKSAAATVDAALDDCSSPPRFVACESRFCLRPSLLFRDRGRDQRHEPRSPTDVCVRPNDWHQLYVDRTAGELATRITFSNLSYAGGDEARRDESSTFAFHVSNSIPHAAPSLRIAATMN